jgi:hypothetical protein
MLPTRPGARRYGRCLSAGRTVILMFFIAEIPVAEDDLNERMNRMRAWLDHQRVEPSVFRLSQTDDRQVVRAFFKAESEAAAFAGEFGGSVVSLPVPDAAIA